jgi:hypothetical protein
LVVIAFRVREKRRLRRIWVVVKDIGGKGQVKHVLNIKFWGGIREGSVYRDLGLEGNV